MFKRGQALIVVVASLVLLIVYIIVNDSSYRVERNYRDLQVKIFTVYTEWDRFTGSLRGLLQTFGLMSDSLTYIEELQDLTKQRISGLQAMVQPMDPQIKQSILDFIASIDSGIEGGQRIIHTGHSFLKQPDTPASIIEGRVPISSILGKDVNSILGPKSAFYFFQLIRQLKEMNSLFDSLYSKKINSIIASISNRSEQISQQFFIVRIVVLGATILAICSLIFQLFSLNRFLRKLANRTNQELISTQSHLSQVQSNLQSMQFQQSLFVMVTGIAHELNTPLGNSITVSSFLQTKLAESFQIMSQDGIAKEEIIKRLGATIEGMELLNKNLGHMRQQIDTFKLLASANSEKKGQAIAISDYINDRLKGFFRAISPSLEYSCSFGNLGAHVLNTGELNDIFMQLSQNSVQHGMATKIHVGLAEANDTLLIEFSDNGTGVDEEVKKRIGEPFFTTARGKNHMGLGLSIVVSLITNKLNGAIQFENTQPGFTVKISIPWAELTA